MKTARFLTILIFSLIAIQTGKIYAQVIPPTPIAPAPIDPAHVVLYSYYGLRQADSVGNSAGIGDVNGDGHADFAVGHPLNCFLGGALSGMAKAYSGRDGTLLYTFQGSVNCDVFGVEIESIGDINQDGVPDIAIGATGSSFLNIPGYVQIYSGATGQLIRTLSNSPLDFEFGRSIAALGDVNGDTYPDFAVGAPYSGALIPSFAGAVYLYSGRDFSIIRTITPETSFDRLGNNVEPVGDINNDGVTDLIVTAPRGQGFPMLSPYVKIFSGRDGTVLFNIRGPVYTWNFFADAGGVGDINGDTIPDFFIASILSSSDESGTLTLYSGQNGAPIYSLTGTPGSTDRLGFKTTSVPDVDGDTVKDLLVGVSGYNNYTGLARIYSGRTGSLLEEIASDNGQPLEHFGSRVAYIGDMDNDGRPNFIIGAPNADRNGLFTNGFANVYHF